MNVKGSKHMSYENRVYIEQALRLGMKCKDIAKNIEMDERTVSKEIQKRRNKVKNGKYGTENYQKMDKEPCKTINKFPFVCNGCKRKTFCFKEFKYFYDAKLAQDNYEIILKDTRIGLDISLENKEVLDSILKDGTDKGQSINHIIETNRDSISYSKSSIYRLVHSNKTTIQKMDLRRAVRLKPRKHYVQKDDNKEIRIGRRYNDFLKAVSISDNPFPIITEMDTVEGPKGNRKCILTIHITNTHFMLMFLLEFKSKEEVSRVFIQLQSTLGLKLYKKLFHTILTDGGTEFCNPLSIELDANTGEKISSVYFCNSYCSYQKGAIEENHTLLRYIIPKGTNIDNLTQDKLDLAMSHINSYYRESLDSTPYELTRSLIGNSFLEKIKTRLIGSNLVNLKPGLIK